MTQSAVWWSSVRLGGCLAQVFLCSCTLAKKHYLSLRRKLFSEKVQRGQMGQLIKLTIWDDLGPFWATLIYWQTCHFWSQDVDADGIDKH